MEDLELQRRVQKFIRSFGLLAQDHTPCGRPLPTSQAHALQVIGQCGELTQQMLAERLNLDKSTTSRLVLQLVERGWAIKEVNPRDRRETLLQLSAQGQVVLGEIQQASADKYHALLKRIPLEKRPQVLEALDLLTEALRTKEQKEERG